MKPYLDDGDVRLYVGDARDVLAGLPEKSVHAVLTSPPFYGLRDYGTGTWEGGDPACDHAPPADASRQGSTLEGGKASLQASHAYRESCARCGAVRVDRQIGLESTPDEWAASLVEVFAACRRVLRDDGSLWVECGDSYAANRTYQVPDSKHRDVGNGGAARVPTGMKPKDLVGAPWLLAFALRADGWWLRGSYIWEKPDCMPESSRDRCTTSHSYLFHLAKSSRYFFDRHAILEPFSDYSTGGNGGSYGGNADAVRPPTGGPRGSGTYLRNRGDVADGQFTLDGDEPEREVVGPDGRRKLEHKTGDNGHENYENRDGAQRWPSLEGRSPRSVWRITTEANSFGLCPACRRFWPERAPATHCGVDVVAHFAVWPHKLVERIIACSTSERGVCADCGTPRVRVTTPLGQGDAFKGEARQTGRPDGAERRNPRGGQKEFDSYTPPEHLGWEAACECAAATVPATVLDPFGGSGTTARQARKMGRHCVLVELSPDYAEIASHRLSQLALPLAVDA